MNLNQLLKKFTQLSIFLILPFVINAQQETAFFNAFKKQDVVTMESFMMDRLEFCILDDQKMLSKNKVLAKMTEFFTAQKISDVQIIHNGSSKDNSSQYHVAKVTTDKSVYRLFVYSSGKLQANSIKEIRLDKF